MVSPVVHSSSIPVFIDSPTGAVISSAKPSLILIKSRWRPGVHLYAWCALVCLLTSGKQELFLPLYTPNHACGWQAHSDPPLWWNLVEPMNPQGTHVIVGSVILGSHHSILQLDLFKSGLLYPVFKFVGVQQCMHLVCLLYSFMHHKVSSFTTSLCRGNCVRTSPAAEWCIWHEVFSKNWLHFEATVIHAYMPCIRSDHSCQK